MELKRKQGVLRKRFGFRLLVCLASIIGSVVYLIYDDVSKPIWGVILGLCGSALVWALVELFDFVIQTHHQYESERNAFWGFVLDHFRMMKDEIRADVDNIPMHELHRIVKDLYGELNKFVFSSNVYSVSREFEMCSNYLERMYWKFDSCCHEINDEYEDRDEYYKKLYDALLLKKEEKEATSKHFFDGFFVQKSAAKMADVELSFEQYKLPENMVDYGVVGNISDEFVIPGNIRKTTTFIPDLRFLELRNQNNCSALYCCLCLLLRRVKVSMDVVHKKTVFERILAFTKTEKYKIWEKRITGAMMVGVSVHIAVVYLLFAIGSSLKEEKCLTPFVYVSFALSTLILAISVIKKWKGYVKQNRGYCLIVAIFLSFVYAALRLKYWPGMWQYEDLGTALVILASYLVMVFEKDKTE